MLTFPSGDANGDLQEQYDAAAADTIGTVLGIEAGIGVRYFFMTDRIRPHLQVGTSYMRLTLSTVSDEVCTGNTVTWRVQQRSELFCSSKYRGLHLQPGLEWVLRVTSHCISMQTPNTGSSSMLRTISPRHGCWRQFLPLRKNHETLSLCLLAPLSLGFLSACSITDSGSGTETMCANVSVSYSRRLGSKFCTATLNTPGGLPVENATIVLTDGDGTSNNQAQMTRTTCPYRSFDGYVEELYLSITSPQDGELDAVLAGPTRHVIVSPLHSSTVSLSDVLDGLRVVWNAEHGLKADEVVLRVPEKTQGFGEDDDEVENFVYQLLFDKDKGLERFLETA